MRAFQKELLNHPFKFNGNTVTWEPVSRRDGVRLFDETKDGPLIAVLDAEADAKRNGIRRISPESYDMLKKNTNSVKSASRSPDVIVSPIRLSNPESVVPKFRTESVASPAAPVSAPQPPPAPPAPPVQTVTPSEGETLTRKKAKRGKLTDLLQKEKALTDP